MASQPAGSPTRVRDPDRGDKILASAATLFASRGFHAVSMADIGQDAGIVGSGIYRHFTSKVAVLVALLDRAMTQLLDTATGIVDAHQDAVSTMASLVQTQIEFCLDERLLVQLYRNEHLALADDDSRRLRRMQRRYNEEWVTTLMEVRPELNDAEARAIVHACIGAVQSIVTYESSLGRDDQIEILTSLAQSCLSAG
jgi:AcrR family transcriptional regulator